MVGQGRLWASAETTQGPAKAHVHHRAGAQRKKQLLLRSCTRGRQQAQQNSENGKETAERVRRDQAISIK